MNALNGGDSHSFSWVPQVATSPKQGTYVILHNARDLRWGNNEQRLPFAAAELCTPPGGLHDSGSAGRLEAAMPSLA